MVKDIYKYLPVLLLLVISSHLLVAQKRKHVYLHSFTSIDIEDNRHVSFFFLLGHNYSGFRTSIQEGMKKSGFSGIQYSSLNNQRIVYPVLQERLEMGVGVSAGLSSKSGVNLKLEMKDWIKVVGYNINDGEFAIDSQLRTASLNYIYRFKGNRSEVAIGPTFFNHYVKASNNQKQENYGMGFECSYLYKINTLRKPWELGFKTEFCWIPQQEIGPFETNMNDTFNTIKVNPNLLSIGVVLGVGWKSLN
ncbi:MAG: hypothetical protein CMO01_11790 [Thalassobius sp.]|nr:hypothetical protein [Thalassovita sp.]